MTRIFSSEKRMEKIYTPIIKEINNVEHKFQILSNIELKEKTRKLKEEVFEKKCLNEKIIIEGFALTREASKRSLGLRHYETQLLGGLILNDGKIAEMKTGEGKTLVATAPAFVNALEGKGVHIVSVNDYLTQRDAEWMGQIYRLLGLRVGRVHEGMKLSNRKKNYNRDITYLTNSELGFDFLRDNLATDTHYLVQRPLNFSIIDEVDSILIDEARTPLIISGESEILWTKVFKASEVVKFLVPGLHFLIDKKAKMISFTEKGIKKTQILLNISNIYDVNNPWIPFILNALKAKHLFFHDIDYITKNNEIAIVDQFTGRIMESRKWGDGLHEAIEAKEGILSLKGTDTLSSITYQSFFRMYPKIAGMTGTAKTESLEFETVYNLLVSVVPTFRPTIRKDLDDIIYINETSKWRAVAQECLKKYKEGQPVLVGTTTIQNSETLSSLLKDYKIPYQLLNAKPENLKQETEIIAQAGCLNTITIATNMAGRGTDILLGGNPEFETRRQTYKILSQLIENVNVDPIFFSDSSLQSLITQIKKDISLLNHLQKQKKFDTLLNIVTIPNKKLNPFENLICQLYTYLFQSNKKKCLNEKSKVKEVGGLYVIGTERHESRRIDNQLRGRAGRQGDPGKSRFFLSLNDPLLKQFGGSKIENLLKILKLSNESMFSIESHAFSQSLDSAQKKIEAYNYSQRNSLNKYDKVLNTQRTFLYKFRYQVLITLDFRNIMLEFGESFINELIEQLEKSKNKLFLNKKLSLLLNSINLSLEEINSINKDKKKLQENLYLQLWSVYEKKEVEFSILNINFFTHHQKTLFLKYIDLYWSKHLENMNFLKESVSWQAYAQKDPFIKYEKESVILFQLAIRNCRDSIISDFLSSDLS